MNLLFFRMNSAFSLAGARAEETCSRRPRGCLRETTRVPAALPTRATPSFPHTFRRLRGDGRGLGELAEPDGGERAVEALLHGELQETLGSTDFLSATRFIVAYPVRANVFRLSHFSNFLSTSCRGRNEGRGGRGRQVPQMS